MLDTLKKWVKQSRKAFMGVLALQIMIVLASSSMALLHISVLLAIVLDFAIYTVVEQDTDFAFLRAVYLTAVFVATGILLLVSLANSNLFLEDIDLWGKWSITNFIIAKVFLFYSERK